MGAEQEYEEIIMKAACGRERFTVLPRAGRRRQQREPVPEAGPPRRSTVPMRRSDRRTDRGYQPPARRRCRR
jgi:hypothetical protein